MAYEFSENGAQDRKLKNEIAEREREDREYQQLYDAYEKLEKDGNLIQYLQVVSDIDKNARDAKIYPFVLALQFTKLELKYLKTKD